MALSTAALTTQPQARRGAQFTIFRKPLRGPIESGFGWRWGRMHEGIDIGVRTTRRIHAPLRGVVQYVGWYYGYGLMVRIVHHHRIRTLYAHLGTVYVHRGQRLRQGALIGLAGCSGSCTGTHLHFEVRIRGRLIDPLRIIGHRVRR